MSSSQKTEAPIPPPVLSMRIITTDNSLEKPIASLDVTTSPFRKTSVRRVPVLHLFGATTQGETAHTALKFDILIYTLAYYLFFI